MRKLLVVVLCLLLPACAFAEAGFEDVCNLMAETIVPLDTAYALLEEGFDTVDQVTAGTLSTEDGLARLQEISAQLMAMRADAVEISPELKAYMEQRGIIAGEFASVSSSVESITLYYVESLDIFIKAMREAPTLPLDTTMQRDCTAMEKMMDFYGLNTLLLPADDAEAALVQRIVIDATPFLASTGLAWERDMELCLSKIDAVEAAYTEYVQGVEAQTY